MSYDVFVRDQIGDEHWVGNMTDNVAPMFTKALGRSLGDLDEMSSEQAMKVLAGGIANMIQFPGAYAKLNPANGWGNAKGALAYLDKIYQACQETPKGTVMIR